MTKRVIIDTNIYISAFLSPRSRMRELVKWFILNTTIFFSKETFLEPEASLKKSKIVKHLSISDQRVLLRQIKLSSQFVELDKTYWKSFSRDPDDDKFFNLAVQIDADWLINGDKDVLEAPVSRSFSILSPKNAINRIAETLD